MKKLFLSTIVILLLPGLLQAAVEFRFVSESEQQGTQYSHDREDERYYLDDQVVLNAADIEAVSNSFTSGGVPSLALELTTSGRENLARLTSENVGKSLALLLGDRVIMVVGIGQTIDTRRVNLPVYASLEEITSYASKINAEIVLKEVVTPVAEKDTQPTRDAISDRLNRQSNQARDDGDIVLSKLKGFVSGLLANGAKDKFASLFPLLIVGLVLWNILRSFIFGIFKKAKQQVGNPQRAKNKKASKLLTQILANKRSYTEESPTDKGQRLIGDGEYVQAIKFLRVHLKGHPNDVQAKALFINACEWSGLNQKRSTRQSKATRKVAEQLVKDQTRARLRSDTSMSDSKAQATMSSSLTKEQAMRMGKDLLNQFKAKL